MNRSLQYLVIFTIALVPALASPAAAATETETVTESWAFELGEELAVSNTNGSIVIESWDRQEVSMRAEKKVRAGDRNSARETLDELEILIDRSAGRLEIRTRHPKRGLFGGSSGSVEYHFMVPVELALDIDTTNGGIEATGVRGDIRLGTTNGGIELHDGGGTVRAGTTNGDIDVLLLTVPEGERLDLSTTNGGIRLTVPSDIRGDLDASTTNGSIQIDLPVTIQGRVSKRRLAGEINGGGGEIRLSTTNGSIRVKEL